MRSATVLLVVFGLASLAIAQTAGRGYVGLGLADAPGAGGAIVRAVAPGGPADQAGIEPNDIIVAINGAAVPDGTSMTRMIGAMAPYQTARLTLIRPGGPAGQRLTINVVIGTPNGSTRPANGAAPPPAPEAPSPAPSASAARGPVPTPSTGSTPSPVPGPLKVSGYTRVTDPIEQAFTVEVPSGWQSAAGLARRAALQINPYVRSLSPDKMTYLMMGDPSLPSFSPPSQMGNMIGAREGTFHDAGLGGVSLIMHYLPGAQFARAYAETMLPGLCPGLKFVSSRDRPDLAHDAEVVAPTVIPSRVDGGEVIFTCTHNKQEMEVHVSAATRNTNDNVIWSVILLGGFITPKGQVSEAEAIITHMAGSLTFNQAWVQKQNSLSQQAAEQINRNMQRFFQQERSFIQNLNSVDQNFESMDEIVSGFSTYHDAATGNNYSLNNTNPYKWIDNSTGRIVSTPTNSPPPWGPAYTALPRGPQQ